MKSRNERKTCDGWRETNDEIKEEKENFASPAFSIKKMLPFAPRKLMCCRYLYWYWVFQMLSLFYIEKYKYTYILVEEKKKNSPRKLHSNRNIQADICSLIYT